ncbi:MAG: exodeoxyribonuclease VII small subunit [Gemmatimonadota bacterium]
MARTPAAPATDASAEPRLGVLLARLEEIRRELDRDDVDLEDQLALYREGCTHVLAAKRILNSVRSEVEILMTETGEAPLRGMGE